VAVACKNCPCGHIFFVARRSAAALIQNKVKEAEKTHKGPPTPPEPTTELSGRRRTERVKRDKPDFYNASEYDKQRKVGTCNLYFHLEAFTYFLKITAKIS